MNAQKTFTPRIAIVLALILSLGLALTLTLPVKSATVATYTVNSTNDVDDGNCNGTHCSLREAIKAANNSAGSDTINFSISGCSGGVCTIKPASNLPSLTGGSTTIDGSTSADKIELDGSLIISGGIGLRIISSNNLIRGLVINRFGDAGIEISSGTNNVIEGNYIGTDTSGTIDRGNGSGVRLSSVHNNQIGGTAAAQRNLISGNSTGVVLTDSYLNMIMGNLIGVDASGAISMGNTYQGILIQGSSYSNVIGGDTTSQRNVISANEVGVEISGPNAEYNTVGANHIGVDVNGTAVLGNTLYGVSLVDGANHNTIGGYAGSPRNVISGNGSHGVFISGDGSDYNTVSGNYIGTNSSSSAVLSNNGDGVIIRSQAAHNTIGGDSAEERNVISGNSENGVEIYLDSNYNQVTGNYIGLNWNATADFGNAMNGVLITDGSQYNTIGGDHDLGLGNVISSNTATGVLITGSGTYTNTVKGNYIGVNPAGTTMWGNGDNGVKIDGGAMYNIIGGAQVDGMSNVISANASYGVYITGSATAQNHVRGNMIGLTADGNGVLGNSYSGVYIYDASNNVIGGADFYRNWITGNETNGVAIGGANASGNLVAGNYIGLDFTGESGLGNNARGVYIFGGAHDNVIGRTLDDGRNLISGNGWSGVEISGGSTQHNTVAHNYIGTDKDGLSDLGNHIQGVLIYEAANNTIGGDALDEGNLISGNADNGVHLDAAVGNTVMGNYIGTNRSGVSSLANDANGVSLSNGAANNVIGGDSAGERNIISGNGGDGVSIFGSGTDGNTISGNHIGVSASGIGALPNGEDGVWIGNQASGNTIGGDTADERNVISSNNWNGVSIAGSETLKII